jgi:hypothetical protein
LEQSPNLQTLLAYEILFRTPVRNLFEGVHQDVEQKLLWRIRLLIQKLATSGYSRMKARKIEILNEFLSKRSLAATCDIATGKINATPRID